LAAQEQENNAKETEVSDSVQRMLQNGGAQSGFGLQIELKDDFTSDSDSTSDSNNQGTGSGSKIAVAVVVLIILSGGCRLGFLFCKRRYRREDKEENIVNCHSKATSIDTNPISSLLVSNVLIPKSA
jgi:hypothetical protein